MVGVYPNITPEFPILHVGLLNPNYWEIFTKKSQVIPPIFGLVSPPFLSHCCQQIAKGYIAPSNIFWPSPGQFGPRSLFHTLRLLLRKGNLGFLGDIGWSLSKHHSHDSPILYRTLSVGSCSNFSCVLFP